jgi:hypothetical protein
MRSPLAYRPRRGPLGEGSALAASAYLGSFAVAAFLFDSPLVLAGIAAAVVATRNGDSEPTAGTTAKPSVLVKTVTARGTTVERTVTTAPPATTAAPPATTVAQSGAALNDAGYAKMRAGDYAGALPLLEQAVQKLQDSGSTTEAYADYNLAYTRFALGRCDGVLDLLDHSEDIQGHRKEIDHLRKRAQKTCGEQD